MKLLRFLALLLALVFALFWVERGLGACVRCGRTIWPTSLYCGGCRARYCR